MYNIMYIKVQVLYKVYSHKKNPASYSSPLPLFCSLLQQTFDLVPYKKIGALPYFLSLPNPLIFDNKVARDFNRILCLFNALPYLFKTTPLQPLIFYKKGARDFDRFLCLFQLSKAEESHVGLITHPTPYFFKKKSRISVVAKQNTESA